VWVAIPFLVGSAAGNGAAIICNQVLVQRGAPDRYRGRALAFIMSSNYAILGLAMAAAGVLTDAYGARWVLLGAAAVNLVAVLVSLAMTRWLPATREEEEAFLGMQPAVAGGMFVPAVEGIPAPVTLVEPATDGTAKDGLERIALLLEEIETRREHEARRARSSD
jgi:MFS family permease